MLNHKQTASNNLFPNNYAQIIEKMNAINPKKYASTRNFINGDITYLAPYISRGVISVKQVMDTVLNNKFSIKEAEKLIQELAWREYFQRVLQNKKQAIWQDLKQPQADVVHHKMLSALNDAQTGIEVVDQQLAHFFEFGYLHNHLRMYIASIACNIGKSYWKEPAKWMYYHLLDGDIASNTCSWQWVAGAFSSKKYYCNQENINKYTNSNQTGTFLDKSYEQIVSMPIPSSLLDTQMIQLKTNLPKTASPIIDTTKPTLVYHSYNLDPNWRSNENVNRVLLLEPTHFEKYPVSDKVIKFIIALAQNIADIQIVTGEIIDIVHQYESEDAFAPNRIISKEHPLFDYYPGIKEERDWMFPTVNGYYPSFFSYWKKCERLLF